MGLSRSTGATHTSQLIQHHSLFLDVLQNKRVFFKPQSLCPITFSQRTKEPPSVAPPLNSKFTINIDSLGLCPHQGGQEFRGDD